MHERLKRQIAGLLGDAQALAPELLPLIEAISAAYQQSDAENASLRYALDQAMLEIATQKRVLSDQLSERQAAEDRLKHSLSILGATLNSTGDGILVVNNDRKVESFNKSFAEMWKIPEEIAEHRDDHVLLSYVVGQLVDPEKFIQIVELLSNSDEIRVDFIEFKDGRVLERYTQPRWIEGNRAGRVWCFSDVTHKREYEKQLERIAHYDALTNLPNRVLLANRLQYAMSQVNRQAKTLALAYLDLDGFKIINDQHGHGAGDSVLMTVATRMKQTLRESDTLARMGGDEFVVILPDLIDINSSVPLLLRLLRAAAEPVEIDNLVLQVSASLGVSFYPQSHDVDADLLLRQADQAMYQAKLAGKNRYHFFDAELDRSIRSHHESQNRLRRALSDREFVLFYQPKVNMRSGDVIGVEALIRWLHPEDGLLSPAMFLPVIEDHPLAIDVGEWVIETALAQLETWHSLGLETTISVNISAYQLLQSSFVDRLQAALATHPRVKPSQLMLEVLETSALEDVFQASTIIAACRKIGVMCSLDDFGTGYSSLTYLKRLPVAEIKIDQSFVRDMLGDKDDLAIVEGVIRLASAFDRRVVAEGVETEEHRAMLLSLGCELGQGYGIARPMPAIDVPAWVIAWGGANRRTEPSLAFRQGEDRSLDRVGEFRIVARAL